MTDPANRVRDPAAGDDSGRLAAVARGACRRARRPSWLARAAGAGLCVASVGFVVAFALVLGTGGFAALVTTPRSMQVALALPYLVAALTAGTVVGAALAWREGYWSLAARVHQTLLALLGVGFVWKLVALGFLP